MSSIACSSYREALSARVDGELHELDRDAVDAHVLGCAECTSFSAGLPLVAERVAAFLAVPVRDGTAEVLAAAGAQRLRGAAGRSVRDLRGLLGVAAVVQLVIALTALTGFGDHLTRDLAIYELAASVGLGAVAWRPRLAAGVLPVVGMAAVLGLVTTMLDVVGGVSTLGAEFAHVAMVVAVWPLAVLARGAGGVGTVAT